VFYFSACDITLFPGNPGANTLDAIVPSTLPIGVAVDYICTDANYAIMGDPTSNQCDVQGMYGPVATCVLGNSHNYLNKLGRFLNKTAIKTKFIIVRIFVFVLLYLYPPFTRTEVAHIPNCKLIKKQINGIL